MKNIRIILIETSHPGNIGATARAMKNMGLTELILVNPKQYPCAEATARAAGADSILAQAKVCQTLDEALSDCCFVFGTSARWLRTVDWPQVDARECAQMVVNDAQQHPVAILFGRERSGLTNQEMERCHYLTHIPTDSTYSSINVAMAVQIICYEVRMVTLLTNKLPSNRKNMRPLATYDNMERLYDHIQETLIDIGFFKEKHSSKFMRRVRRLFNRIRLREIEINIMRGILSSMQQLTNKKKD